MALIPGLVVSQVRSIYIDKVAFDHLLAISKSALFVLSQKELGGVKPGTHFMTADGQQTVINIIPRIFILCFAQGPAPVCLKAAELMISHVIRH